MSHSSGNVRSYKWWMELFSSLWKQFSANGHVFATIAGSIGISSLKILVQCFYFILFYFMLLLLLLFKYSCVHFPPTTLSCPTHSYLPPSILPPFVFVHVSFMHVPWWPFPFFPHCYHLLPSPLVTVSLFLISMSLVIFCLLFSSIDYVPVKGEIIWYLSFTTWLTSLSILLSSSIRSVAKGRSSFFLSAV